MRSGDVKWGEKKTDPNLSREAAPQERTFRNKESMRLHLKRIQNRNK